MNPIELLNAVDPNWLLLGVTTIGVLVAVRAIREQTRNSRLEKVADVLMECARRYAEMVSFQHDLEAAVRRGEVDEKRAAERFFHAYWNLQWDQWNFFLLGLLPHQILTSWILQRKGMLNRSVEMFGVSFEDGWTSYGKVAMRTYPAFSAFVDGVWSLKDLADEGARLKIDALLDRSFRDARKMRVDFTRRSISRSL